MLAPRHQDVVLELRTKLAEGRMKGLAFALDPDGYWVELLRGGVKGRNTLAQTMLRVKEMGDQGLFLAGVWLQVFAAGVCWICYW